MIWYRFVPKAAVGRAAREDRASLHSHAIIGSCATTIELDYENSLDIQIPVVRGCAEAVQLILVFLGNELHPVAAHLPPWLARAVLDRRSAVGPGNGTAKDLAGGRGEVIELWWRELRRR